MSTATTMQSFVEQFLDERHRLGFASRSMGHALRSFASYVDGLGLAGPLRIEVMVRWARCPKNASDDPATRARRLKVLRPFAHERLGKAPSELRLVDIAPDLILAFLDDLEQRRNNSVHSRNLRLTALRAFLKFAAHRDVASLQAIEAAAQSSTQIWCNIPSANLFPTSRPGLGGAPPGPNGQDRDRLLLRPQDQLDSGGSRLGTVQ